MMWQSPMMGWMWIWSLAVLAVLAGLLWLAVRWTGPQRSGPTAAPRLHDARDDPGEIDDDEYVRREAELMRQLREVREWREQFGMGIAGGPVRAVLDEAVALVTGLARDEASPHSETTEAESTHA